MRTQSNLLLTYSGVHSCLGIWCAVVSACVHVHVPNLRPGIYPPQLAILFSEVSSIVCRFSLAWETIASTCIGRFGYFASTPAIRERQHIVDSVPVFGKFDIV